MKKYIGAGVAALMVFAISAFAATLFVDGGTLQSGVDNDLTCTETAKVTYDHHVDYHHQALDAWVENFFVTFDDASCVGNTMYLTVAGQGAAVKEITGTTETIPVTNGDSWGNGVSISDINSVSVTIWSDGKPGNGGHCVGGSGYGWASGVFSDLSDGGSSYC